LKIASNSPVARSLSDIIDFDCGPALEGKPINELAKELLGVVIATASGDYRTKAAQLQQYDFTFWRRDISL
jgi:altronate hydrolase